MTSSTKLKSGYRIIYYFVLFGLFFQFFAYPVYAITTYFPHGIPSKYYIPFVRPDEAAAIPEWNVAAPAAPVRTIVTDHKITENREVMVLELHAPEKTGVIGYDNESNSDDPSDNLFSFEVDKHQLYDKELRLSYEVFGIGNTSGIARSINEHTATGGFFVQKTNQWQRMEELISVEQLKEGINHVLFTTFEGRKLDYKVRNVKITALPEQKQRYISLADGNSLYVKEGKAYVKGSVLPSDAQLFINDIRVPVRNHEFEAVLENALGLKHLDIRLTKKDGTEIYTDSIAVTSVKEVSQAVPYVSPSVLIPVRQAADGSYGFALADVDLSITSENYEAAERITVQKLRDIDAAPVGTNIINVTSGAPAYRFLPDGARFAKPAKITLKYDSKLLPKGYNAHDVKVLYFDMQQRRWLTVPTDTIVAATLVLSYLFQC